MASQERVGASTIAVVHIARMAAKGMKMPVSGPCSSFNSPQRRKIARTDWISRRRLRRKIRIGAKSMSAKNHGYHSRARPLANRAVLSKAKPAASESLGPPQGLPCSSRSGRKGLAQAVAGGKQDRDNHGRTRFTQQSSDTGSQRWRQLVSPKELDPHAGSRSTAMLSRGSAIRQHGKPAVRAAEVFDVPANVPQVSARRSQPT
jgi:hypothetical protein